VLTYVLSSVSSVDKKTKSANSSKAGLFQVLLPSRANLTGLLRYRRVVFDAIPGRI